MELPIPSGVDVPLSSLSELREVHAPSLVLAQQADSVHSADLASELAAALPNATLRILEPGGVFWTQADQTRSLLSAHFA